MVAPSYKNYKQVSEPYQKNGKTYIKLEHPNTHNIREARYYTEQEYQKQYGSTAAGTPKASTEVVNPSGRGAFGKILKPLKDVLGFNKGYITIFKGEVEAVEEWFKISPCRYHNAWGWYLVSTDEMPDPIPAGIEPVLLNWEEVSINDETLKARNELQEVLSTKLYPPSNSKHIGSLGERLALKLKLHKDIVNESIYGISHFYIFSDEEGNIFTWNTQAKTLAPGTTYSLKGTVKEHVRFKGEAQTSLTRCTILS